MTARRDVAARMAEAALGLLDSLTPAQRELAAFPFPDSVDPSDERHRWFYTPTDHGGLPLHGMSPAQHRLTHQLVASGTSRAGYVTVSTIMGLDNVLDLVEGWVADFERERGRDPGLYYVRIFGDPAGDDPWSWRFGGHHVSVHHVVVDGEVVGSTPCFLGADPATSPLLGPHLLRPLGAAEDLGFELVRSLDEEQRHGALLSRVAPVDLVTANRARLSDGDRPLHLADVWRRRFRGELAERIDHIQATAEEAAGLRDEHLEAVSWSSAPKGLRAAALRPDQREVLRALLDVYVGRVPEELADEESAKYATDDDLAALSFAWAGGLEPGEPHYYRVQGERLLAEYDNTQRGANHIHTVWRDPVADFGDDVLARHYRQGHGSHHHPH